MKKIVKYIRLFVLAVFAMIALHSCELAGLELQQPFEYDYNAGQYNNELNMTAWEFIQSRPDLFSLMQEGIVYAGMQDMYNQPNCTFLVLTNAAFNSSNLADSSYFYKNRILNVVPASLTAYPVEQVQDLLKYHIVKGAYTWSNLPAFSTWYDTYADGENAKVNMYLIKDRNATILFNGYVGHYNTNIRARTTNLKTSDGSYVHVLERWLRKPTLAQIAE